MKKTLFMSLMLGIAAGVAMADTAYYCKPTPESEVPSGKTEWTGQELGADHLWFAYSGGQIEVAQDMTVNTGNGQLWVGPTGAANGTMTISGDIEGSGKIVLNTWAGANVASLYNITGDASGFSGTVAIERASGSGWGQLNLSGTTLSNAVIGQSNASSSILNIGGNTTIKGLSTSSTFRVTSTNADNTLTLNVTSDMSSGATIGAVTNNTYFENHGVTETTPSQALSLVKQGGSTQTLSGTVTLKNLNVQGGALNFSGTANVTGTTTVGGTLRATGGNLTLHATSDTLGALCAEGGNIKLETGTTTVNNLWLKKGSEVLINEGAELWAGAVKIISAGETASVGISSAVTDTGSKKYEANNNNFMLTGVTLTSRTESWAASELKNVLSKVTVNNVRDGFKVTWNDANSLVSATAGATTNFVNGGDAGISLSNLTIAAGKTVGVYKSTTVEAGDNDANIAKLAVGTLVVSGDDATLNANLDLTGTTELTLNGTLTMGCSVELGDGGIVLGGSVLDALELTTIGSSVTLFSDVESLTMGGDAVTGSVYASALFSNADLANTDDFKYIVTHNADNSVTLSVVPEPATATLSLLALVGLAARRRRH